MKQKTPDKTAVIEPNREVSYAQLLQNARKIEKLLPHGQPGNIAILLPNCCDYVSAFFAVIMSGKTVMPINILMTANEIFPLLNQAAVDTIITTSAFQSVFEQNYEIGERFLNIIFLDNLSAYENEFENNTASDAAKPAVNVITNSDKPMILLNTSGTTGTPKIVQLSEKNIQTAVLGYLDKLVFDEAEINNIRYILCVPFSSVYGMMILFACLIMSFPVIVLDNAFNLDALFLAAEKYKATHYEGSTSTILLMEQMAGRTIPYGNTLKYFGFGGSKVSGSSIEKVQKAYKGREFCQGYGMTEASPLISKHPQKNPQKPESVGTAIRGIEIAIDDGNEISVTPFTKGEIVVRGTNVMLGYLGNKTETDKAIKNGYLYTGDIGYLDEEGYLFICGRKKNIIIIRGFNVYPEEVEECIQNSLLAIDCVVYGQSDSSGSETVCADIIPASQNVREKDIIEFCSRHLAGYKLPSKISFVFSIDKNAAGKITRQ